MSQINKNILEEEILIRKRKDVKTFLKKNIKQLLLIILKLNFILLKKQGKLGYKLKKTSINIDSFLMMMKVFHIFYQKIGEKLKNNNIKLFQKI